jgi:hypothetical protein
VPIYRPQQTHSRPALATTMSLIENAPIRFYLPPDDERKRDEPPFRFSDLPMEVRLFVYEHLAHVEYVFDQMWVSKPVTWKHISRKTHSILAVRRELGQEALPVIAARTLTLWMPSKGSAPAHFARRQAECLKTHLCHHALVHEYRTIHIKLCPYTNTAEGMWCLRSHFDDFFEFSVAQSASLNHHVSPFQAYPGPQNTHACTTCQSLQITTIRGPMPRLLAQRRVFVNLTSHLLAMVIVFMITQVVDPSAGAFWYSQRHSCSPYSPEEAEQAQTTRWSLTADTFPLAN